MLIDSVFEEHTSILCYYINTTQQLQMIRSSDCSQGSFEKMVFPQERLIFEAFIGAEVEIYTEVEGESLCLHKIPCTHLRIDTDETNLSYWVEIITEEEGCAYLFGSFANRQDAEVHSGDYREELEEEGHRVIDLQIKVCNQTGLIPPSVA